ncbi:hypothetical protein ACFXDH_33655 [Streptomyces sp. NPDC059467]|uniref:hypothetical protein n=1 Tax=Streptomyces sp. NPDC059467 TaxID=3346844 RepID=UPI0036AEB3BA
MYSALLIPTPFVVTVVRTFHFKIKKSMNYDPEVRNGREGSRMAERLGLEEVADRVLPLLQKIEVRDLK